MYNIFRTAWFERLWYGFRHSKPTPQSVILEPPMAGDARYETVFGTYKIGAPPPPWEEFLPVDEFQGATGDCVSHSRTNAAEVMAKYNGIVAPDNFELNLSALNLAVISGTTLKGNSLRNPSEFFRTKGIVEEKYCTYDPDMLSNPAGTWARRQQKINAIPPSTQKFLGGSYSVLPTHLPTIREALQYSPVQIAVGLGPTYNSGGIIQKPPYITSYHAILLYKVTDRLHILDSIAPTQKQFALDYPIIGALSFRDLVTTWKSVNNTGNLILQRVLGKFVIRAQDPPAKGQLYFVWQNASRIQYLPDVGTIPMFQEFLQWLKIKGHLIGISEDNFNALVKTVTDAGGTVDNS